MASKPPFIDVPIVLLHPGELGAWIGQRFAQRRLAANLTREDLASLAGVSRDSIKMIETRGRSSLETVCRLISALGLQGRLDAFFASAEPGSLDEIAQREASTVRKRARRKKLL